MKIIIATASSKTKLQSLATDVMRFLDLAAANNKKWANEGKHSKATESKGVCTFTTTGWGEWEGSTLTPRSRKLLNDRIKVIKSGYENHGEDVTIKFTESDGTLQFRVSM